MSMHMCSGVCVCVDTRRQFLLSLLKGSLPLFLRQGFSLTWNSTSRLYLLAVEIQGF